MPRFRGRAETEGLTGDQTSNLSRGLDQRAETEGLIRGPDMSTTLSASMHLLLVVSIVLDDTVYGARFPSYASASSPPFPCTTNRALLPSHALLVPHALLL